MPESFAPPSCESAVPMGFLAGKRLLVTGVLGPKSNAHGPNEFIDLAYAKKITAATAMVIAAMT